jgi:tetratricopeptide (TPR) repeat protein
MVVSVVSGTAGVGKTALAVHWSHRVADRFGDGQLYVNLRGFHGNDSAVDPAEAVRWFLDALGVPPDQIPSSVSVQIGLYRTLLAGRRVLIMLDNARDADQVRPLLPGSSACMVVVTSRNQLTGLVATEGAYLLTLDVLARAEARELLAQRLGAARVAAEPEAVNSLVGLAARLPLALAIVAARAAAHPHFPLAALARELRESRGGLDAFAGGDQAADVRAVLSWSYRALSPAAARLVRLLGLHPGPDIATAAAASLADLPAARVRPLLSELTGANLITEHIPGRYHFHDLLRAYATELVHRPDSDAERRAATARMFSHYLHTAHAAAQLLDPHRLPITLDPLCPGVLPEELADREQAVRWFTTEHPTLVSAIGQAAGTGFDAQAWRLAGALVEFLARRGHWHDFAATQRTALIAAERLGDPAGQAHAHHGLGRAYGKLGRYQSAHAHYQHALNEFGALADRTGQGSAHLGTGWLFGLQGRYREALNHARLALDLYQSAGNRAGQANTLNALGWYHAQLGDHEQAIGYCQSALALHAELGERHGEANTWDSLGYAHHQLHRYQQAASHYRRAIDLYRDAGDRYGEAETLTRLGDTHRAAGALDTARDAWRRALTILDELGHRNAARARSKLRSLDADDRSIRLRLDESRSDTARAPRCPGHQRAYPIS